MHVKNQQTEQGVIEEVTPPAPVDSVSDSMPETTTAPFTTPGSSSELVLDFLYRKPLSDGG